MFLRKNDRKITGENLILNDHFIFESQASTRKFSWISSGMASPILRRYNLNLYLFLIKIQIIFKINLKGMKSDIAETITRENWIEEKYE